MALLLREAATRYEDGRSYGADSGCCYAITCAARVSNTEYIVLAEAKRVFRAIFNDRGSSGFWWAPPANRTAFPDKRMAFLADRLPRLIALNLAADIVESGGL